MFIVVTMLMIAKKMFLKEVFLVKYRINDGWAVQLHAG